MSDFYADQEMSPLLAHRLNPYSPFRIGTGSNHITWDELGKLVSEFNQKFIFYRLFIQTPIDKDLRHEVYLYAIPAQSHIKGYSNKVYREEETRMIFWVEGFIKGVQATRRKIRQK